MSATKTSDTSARQRPPRTIAINAPGHYKSPSYPVDYMQARLTKLQDWMFFFGRQNVAKARDVSKEIADLREAIAKATGSAA